MAACPSCGSENAEDAKFCSECGTALSEPVPAREARKTVTVLFCDVTGSTELGESTDPEVLRALLARYFERMKAIVEAHGGWIGLSSTPGVGTTVSLGLPVPDAPVTPVGAASSSAAP